MQDSSSDSSQESFIIRRERQIDASSELDVEVNIPKSGTEIIPFSKPENTSYNSLETTTPAVTPEITDAVTEAYDDNSEASLNTEVIDYGLEYEREAAQELLNIGDSQEYLRGVHRHAA